MGRSNPLVALIGGATGEGLYGAEVCVGREELLSMRKHLIIALLLTILGWTIWFIIGEHMSSVVDDCPSGHCSKSGSDGSREPKGISPAIAQCSDGSCQIVTEDAYYGVR